MVGLVAERVRKLIRGICKEHEVEILKGHVSKDHVHLFVSVPPHPTISKLVQYLKGKTGPPVQFLQTFDGESAVVESVLGRAAGAVVIYGVGVILWPPLATLRMR
jgi:hypothetical protein